MKCIIKNILIADFSSGLKKTFCNKTSCTKELQMAKSTNLIKFNTHYMKSSTIVYLFKMGCVSKTTIYGLKVMVKSGLEKKICTYVKS